jgi:hypothetical protein
MLRDVFQYVSMTGVIRPTAHNLHLLCYVFILVLTMHHALDCVFAAQGPTTEQLT